MLISAEKRTLCISVVIIAICSGQVFAAQKVSSTAKRTARGLQVLYDFGSADGDKVLDRSGSAEPLNLVIEKPANVQRAARSLTINSATKIQSRRPAKRITDAVKKTRQFTVEAWVEPANLTQAGPARIVTLSPHTGERNFTLGQEGDAYDVRFRTSKTDGNGIPSLASKEGDLTTRLTHVVYTRDASGRATVLLTVNCIRNDGSMVI